MSNNSSRVKACDLYQIDPMTKNQQKAFKLWDEGEKNILDRSAGTCKTFLAM